MNHSKKLNPHAFHTIFSYERFSKYSFMYYLWKCKMCYKSINVEDATVLKCVNDTKRCNTVEPR